MITGVWRQAHRHMERDSEEDSGGNSENMLIGTASKRIDGENTTRSKDKIKRTHSSFHTYWIQIPQSWLIYVTVAFILDTFRLFPSWCLSMTTTSATLVWMVIMVPSDAGEQCLGSCPLRVPLAKLCRLGCKIIEISVIVGPNGTTLYPQSLRYLLVV